MSRQAAFLRGMNLGGRRVTNDELKSIAIGAGFEQVDAVLASGNLVFEAPPGETRSSEDALSTALAAALGYDVDVFVRTAPEIEAVLEATPFTTRELAASEGKVQVTFVHDQAAEDALVRVAEHDTDEDRIRVADRCWFWLPRVGISTSELDIRALESVLGVGTTRTRNTVEKVVRKLV